jgi:hypothetical protein
MIGRRAGWAVTAAVIAASRAAAAPSAPSAPPDTLRARGAAVPAVVRIGDRVTVRGAIARPDTGGTLIGPPVGSSFGPVDVVASAASASPPDSSAWTLQVALFRLGDLDLSAIPFRWEKGGSADPVRLGTLIVSVEPVLTDSAATDSLRGIRGPLPVPLHWRWGRIALAAALLAAAVAGWILWRRRRPGEPLPVAPYVPAIPPHLEALAALRELEREALPARGQMKEHYARLSLILRGYLERRFGVPAVDFTTEEIRSELARRESREVGEDVVDLFGEADLVKFARLDPGKDAAGNALGRGRSWVEATAPRPAAEGE